MAVLGQPTPSAPDVSVDQFVAGLDLGPTTRDLLHAVIAWYTGADPREVSVLGTIAQTAGFGHSPYGFFGTLTERFVGGAGRLLDRMVADSSRRVVTALANALQLSDADRVHLHTLTGHPPPAAADVSADTALLQNLVDHLDVPAYCTDALTHVIAWNPRATEIFGDYARWPPHRRNLLRLLFDEPEFADRLADRDEYAARVVRTFRGRSDAYLKDPVAIDLVDDLTRSHPRFKQLWDSRDIRRTDTDTLQVDHPQGRLTLTLVNLQGVATPGTRFNAYLPADRRTLSVLSQL
jgi:PAS domain-containing protein